MNYHQVAHSLRILGFEENGGSETDWDEKGHTATVWYLQMGDVTASYYLPHHDVPDVVEVGCRELPTDCLTLAAVLEAVGNHMDELSAECAAYEGRSQ